MSDPSKSRSAILLVEGLIKPSGSPLSPLESGSPRDRSPPIVQKTPKRTWRSHIWDTWDKPPEERHLLFKLDLALMVYTFCLRLPQESGLCWGAWLIHSQTLASLGFAIKTLDQVNINNAFVSGMKEDLGLYGNQLNYMQTCWTIGSMLGAIPSNILLTRVRPSIWIPCCEVTWSVLTIVMAKCTNANQIYALRFFVGLAESTFYPGMQYIVGSWYRKDELAKRSCLFHAMGHLGSILSSFLMAGVSNLDGVQGYRKWQWLFITNTIVSLPIALTGFFFMPDVPEITRAWYLTPAEIELARRRMALEGRAQRGAPYTRTKFRQIFSRWRIYALVSLYVVFNNGGATPPAFALWLKQQGRAVREVNLYPALAEVMAIAATLAYAWTSDGVFRGARWPAIVFSGAVKLLAYSSLAAAWDGGPDALKWASFLLAGCGAGVSGLIFAWAHEICSDDNEERALVTGAMPEVTNVFQAWLPLLIWQQVEAPRYPKGYPTLVVMAVLLIATSLVTRSLHKREQKRKVPVVYGV